MDPFIKHKIEKIRIKLTPLQAIGHYSYALLPLIFPALDFYYRATNQGAVSSFSTYGYVIWLSLTILIIFLKYRELIGERLYESRTDEQFDDAVFATANKMKWIIEEGDNKNIKVIATNSWEGNNWSRITIKRETKYVEITSIFNFGFSAPDIFGTNKEHRKAFLDNFILAKQINDLNDRAVKELKRKERELENEPEWNLKNTLKRLIAYLVSFAFLILGVIVWKDKGFMFGVVPLFFLGSFYIMIDIYTMWSKRKKSGK